MIKIDINVVFEGDVMLEDGVIIGANCILRNCKIGKDTQINPFSLVEEAIIGKKSFVGPYGRLRPGSTVGDNVQIGNFVEIKNANVASMCRINHHSCVGDADLAELITRLQSLILSKEASQATFSKIGRQTLFDYIR